MFVGSGAFSSSSDFAICSFLGFALGANFLSITAIKLNERNHPLWAKSVHVYLLVKGRPRV